MWKSAHSGINFYFVKTLVSSCMHGITFLIRFILFSLISENAFGLATQIMKIHGKNIAFGYFGCLSMVDATGHENPPAIDRIFLIVSGTVTRISPPPSPPPTFMHSVGIRILIIQCAGRVTSGRNKFMES